MVQSVIEFFLIFLLASHVKLDKQNSLLSVVARPSLAGPVVQLVDLLQNKTEKIPLEEAL